MSSVAAGLCGRNTAFARIRPFASPPIWASLPTGVAVATTGASATQDSQRGALCD
jgi:hypothetical protein